MRMLGCRVWRDDCWGVQRAAEQHQPWMKMRTGLDGIEVGRLWVVHEIFKPWKVVDLWVSEAIAEIL